MPLTADRLHALETLSVKANTFFKYVPNIFVQPHQEMIFL